MDNRWDYNNIQVGNVFEIVTIKDRNVPSGIVAFRLVRNGTVTTYAQDTDLYLQQPRILSKNIKKTVNQYDDNNDNDNASKMTTSPGLSSILQLFRIEENDDDSIDSEFEAMEWHEFLKYRTFRVKSVYGIYWSSPRSSGTFITQAPYVISSYQSYKFELCCDNVANCSKEQSKVENGESIENSKQSVMNHS